MDSPSADRRPIKGWEEFYEITRDGQVYSVRAGRFLKYAEDDLGRKYIEVQIGGIRYERNIAKTVLEAWGNTSQLVPAQINPAPVLDRGSLKPGDVVQGTLMKRRRWKASRPVKRGLFQVVDYGGDPMLRALDPDFPVKACRLSELAELERATPTP